MSKKTKNAKTWLYVLIALFLLFELLVFYKITEFSLWQQVEYLRNTQYEIALPALKIHFLRYWLVLPFYWASSITGYPPSFLFSISIPLLLGMTTLFIKKTKCYKPILGVDDVLVFGTLALLSLAMNGRMIFVLLGTAILIYSAVQMFERGVCTKKTTACLCLSLWLMAVSSGTLIVAYIYVLMFMIFLVLKKNIQCSISQMFALAIVFLFFGAEVFKFFVKNLEYFGGGAKAIAAIPLHGAGKYIGSTLGLMIAAACCLIAAYVLIKSKNVLLKCSASLLLLALGGGVFGLSTLTCTVVPLILVTLISIKAFLTYNFQDKAVKNGEG